MLDDAAVRALVAGLWRDYVATIKTFDADKLAAWFSESAILMGPDTADIIGRRAIAESFKGILPSLTLFDGEIVPRDAFRNGPVICEFGTYRHRMETRDGREMNVTGRYAAMWQHRTDGRWLIARLMLANLAAPATS